MNLRAKLIRLAYEKPELRQDILPLVKKASSGRGLWKRYPHPESYKVAKEVWGHVQEALDVIYQHEKRLERLGSDLEHEYLTKYGKRPDVWSEGRESPMAVEEGQYEHVLITAQALYDLRRAINNGSPAIADDFELLIANKP